MGEPALVARSVLVLDACDGDDRLPSDLVSRIDGLGFTVVCCPSFETAAEALADADEPIHCAIVPTALADRRLKRAVRGLRSKRGATLLHWLAVGPEPERSERRVLRSAGLQHALWEPFDDATLRFQLNRLSRESPGDEIRRARRVPTRLPARAIAGGRSRDASVYSLSESGAFLETPRACMPGAQVRIDLQLPDRMLELEGTVAFANVPGNLQRPNLPLGMGVRFTGSDPGERSALVDYVESRLRQLSV